MMSKNGKKPESVFGPNPLDARVRERFLSSGHLDAKVLEKHLGELPDVADKGESIDLRQPALSAAAEPDDDEDDEED
jgi:hypothetical protein